MREERREWKKGKGWDKIRVKGGEKIGERERTVYAISAMTLHRHTYNNDIQTDRQK